MAAAYPLSARLNRLWRLLATGLGFVFFGVFGVLLQIVLLPWLLRRAHYLPLHNLPRRCRPNARLRTPSASTHTFFHPLRPSTLLPA